MQVLDRSARLARPLSAQHICAALLLVVGGAAMVVLISVAALSVSAIIAAGGL